MKSEHFMPLNNGTFVRCRFDIVESVDGDIFPDIRVVGIANEPQTAAMFGCLLANTTLDARQAVDYQFPSIP